MTPMDFVNGFALLGFICITYAICGEIAKYCLRVNNPTLAKLLNEAFPLGMIWAFIFIFSVCAALVVRSSG